MPTTRRIHRSTIASALACALLACAPRPAGAGHCSAGNRSRGPSGASRLSATIAERLVRTLLVWALAAGLLYSPMTADARPQTRWPTAGQVRIYNPTGWQNTMGAAADAWNRTGVTPTIVFTSRHSGADVVVEASTRKLDQRCDEDYACDGYAERHETWGRITLHDADRDLDRHPSAASVRLAAHELGHILGLQHETHDCALMNTDTGTQRCSPSTDLANIRGPVRTDIAAAHRLYHRELRPDYQSKCALGLRQTAVSARSWVSRERPRARQ
jgi:matrixin